MSVTKVNSLYIYPIKSTAGICLPKAQVEELGLAFDRRFVVSDPAGQFITARTEPRLCLVQTTLTEQGLVLSAPNMPALTLLYEKFSHQYQKVTVWGDEIAGQLCCNIANVWFSDYLQRPCVLLFFGQDSYRERKVNTDKARKLAFADGYPLLLISQASLDDLNQHLSNNQQQAVSMAQFRPNIVVDNCLPFAEDGWQQIRIGKVEFKVSKPCERCLFTTVNPQNAEQHPERQPLSMLKSFRQTHNGEVLFGQNLIALNSGQIKAGDKLTIMSKQKPPMFIRGNTTNLAPTSAVNNNNENSEDSNKQQYPLDSFGHQKSMASLPISNGDVAISKSVNKKLTIFFEKWQKTYQIPKLNHNSNSIEKTLLEHGEEAGLILPSSCRAGMCGRCKAKLISGEVVQSTTEGLAIKEQQEGYILCCSSIAKSDVVIKHD